MKRENEVETFQALTPFNKLMSIWANWNKLRDSGETSGDANLQDTKDFMRTGEAVEAMINNLPRPQWWAIRKSMGISTVWLFPELSLMATLAQAELDLTPKMQNHIATRRYFY